MANSNIQLGKIDFDEIRSSIKTFMEQDSELDFNFDGSIAATVLDLLAYNTLYYAFYSNMLINESFLDSAQRLESLISMVKPFGFTISHRQSASIEAKIKNSSTQSEVITLNPYQDTVVGNLNGLQYTFYYTGNVIDINPLGEEILPFYQGTSAVIEQPVTFNYDAQSFVLNDKSIDIRTLRVYVRENTGKTVEYTRVKNTDSSISAISQVYYLETTNNGYKIVFGGFSNTDGNQIGRGVGSTEIVLVSYVVGSGSQGNEATNFIINKNFAQIINNPTASGGFNSPNLNSIKFLGPRQFSSQGNLVSVSDYEKQITEILTEFAVNQNNPRNNVSVYGGTDAADGTAGFVYFSLYGENWESAPGDPVALSTQVTSNLQNKIPVGLSLEYKTPTNAKITFSLATDTGRAKFYDLYFRGEAGTKGFNQTVKTSEVSNWSKVDVEVSPFLGATQIDQAKVDLKNQIFIDFSQTPLNGETLCVRGQLEGGSEFIATASDGSGTLKSGATTIATVSGSEIDFTTENFSSLTGISCNYDISAGSLAAEKIIVEDELLGELAS